MSRILTLNGGASSLKFAVFEAKPPLKRVLDGKVDRIEDPRAAVASVIFCYEITKRIGAFAAAMGGIEGLVFTGGIGENAAPIRARICERLGFLGMLLDSARNETGGPVISQDGSPVSVRVIRTDEERVIAEAVAHTLRAAEQA